MGGEDPSLLMLRALARTTSAGAGPGAVYSTIAQTAASALGAKAARVWVNDPAASRLVASGSFGVEAETEARLLTAVRLPHGAGVPGRIVVSRLAEFIADAHDDPRWVNARYIRELDFHAYAGLPLVAEGSMVGVLSVLFGAPRVFTKDERERAGLLASHAATIIRISQLFDEARRTAALDAVVRLANATAHELNNPLTVVLGHLTILEAQLGGRPDALERVRRIEGAARRAAEIVERLNRIVRVEAFLHDAEHLPPMLDLGRSSDG